MNAQTPPPGKGPAGLISDVMNHVSNLVRKEIDLARAELSENINRAAIAIGLLVGAIVVALVALHVLAAALVAGIADLGLDPGWAALIVGVALSAAALGMVLKGVRDLKMTSLAPSRTMKNMRRDAGAVSDTLKEDAP